MAASNVLRVNTVEEEKLYLDAVHNVIAGILREKEGRTLIDIAEAIDVSKKTISNAYNKTHSLSHTFLTRLGKAFGPHVLNPYMALMGARAVPMHTDNVIDILPTILRLSTKVADARHPDSPGGCAEVHTEKLGYLPDLEKTIRDLEGLLAHVRELAA